MYILKSAAIAFSLTVAMGTFSTAAVAESDPGRVSHNPASVVVEIDNRIDAAVNAINNGAEGDDVIALIKKAREFTKELNANDKVSRETAKVRAHLKNAEASAKTANLQDSKAHLAEAKKANAVLKTFM